MLKQDTEEQVCYYQAGIGTYFQPGVVSPLLKWFATIADEAVAWYLGQHIREGYTFLMQNYREGDKICIFGFSRGAYTARALAGMLYKIGLLGKDNPEQVPFAYKLYKRTDKTGIQLSAGFKQTFCQNVNVEFLGVWETVSSVGVIMGKTLPFTNSNTSIKTFRQALALDEHRAKFLPNLYHRPAPNPSQEPANANPIASTLPTTANPFTEMPTSLRKLNIFKKSKSKGGQGTGKETRGYIGGHDEASVGITSGVDEVKDATDSLEVWFAGCHSDVGGGSVPDTTENSLSQTTLRWMVREIITSQCGILLDSAAMRRNGMYDDNDIAVFQISPVEAGPHELAKDQVDALQPIHDPLKQTPLWWILEVLPTQQVYQGCEGQWVNKWSIHLGKGRKIPFCDKNSGPRFHVSVKERMEDQKLKYKPKAVWPQGTEVYVQ
ncbi:hypothetical protein FIBSPDRAFT_1045889 [Athelia psychrophila]|uniref:T6SS Phospholipase effector Tle1-like catalytic domain-containing protein n=1 Tax=Athelia psychrophila TaxID=1759441 RepID=A0A166HKK4_9AGAM|nr:hypothetical protein FIBSPDRAFT_1045889 [Fibularhizoctonia sp. CBS 109695]